MNSLSFFSRSRSDMGWKIFLFNQGGSMECFTRLWWIGACLLTTSINSLYHTARASLGSVCCCTLSNGVQIKSAKNAFWLKCLKDLNEIYVCPLGSGFGNWIDLVQVIGLWSVIFKSETSVVTTALGLFVQMLSINDVEVGVVRVGELMRWASPKRARVESQHNCGFSM